MVSDRRWKQLVREGKSLIRKAAKDRLFLGAYAQEIEPNGSSHGGDRSRGAAAPLAQYAEEIDIALDTLREYRDVLLKWHGDPDRVPDISWTAMREIADIKDADPFEVYKAVKREHGIVNSVTVRKYRQVPAWNHAGTKVRQAKRLLADPDVVNALAQDEEGMAAIQRVERQNREYGDIGGTVVDEHLKPIRRGMGNVQESIDPVMTMFADLVKRMTEITRDDIDIDPEDWSMIRHHWKKITEELEVYALRRSLPSVTSGVK